MDPSAALDAHGFELVVVDVRFMTRGGEVDPPARAVLGGAGQKELAAGDDVVEPPRWRDAARWPAAGRLPRRAGRGHRGGDRCRDITWDVVCAPPGAQRLGTDRKVVRLLAGPLAPGSHGARTDAFAHRALVSLPASWPSWGCAQVRWTTPPSGTASG